MKKKFVIAVSVLFFVFSLIYFSGCPRPSSSSEGDVPVFSLEKIGGGRMTNRDFEGKVVFIDFWAIWCGPCRSATPYVIKLHEQFKGTDLLVIGMNLDYNKSVREVEEFTKKEKIEYIVLKGDQTISNSFKIRGIPAFFLIDRRGNISKKYVGFNPAFFKQMSEDIDKLLKEK